jgi:hypothetical protein
MGATVLPKASDRWIALVAGGGVFAATTAVTISAVPFLPPMNSFVVGVGIGVAAMTLVGVVGCAWRGSL